MFWPVERRCAVQGWGPGAHNGEVRGRSLRTVYSSIQQPFLEQEVMAKTADSQTPPAWTS